MANTNRKLFHTTLNLNPIKFKNEEYLNPNISTIHDIHVLKNEDITRLLHEYEQDIDEEMPPEEIKPKFAELLGVPKNYVNKFL
jgi:hypothetical protein